MDKAYREALQVTKEIIVKFIETQRVSPSNFSDVFPAVHKVVLNTILQKAEASSKEDAAS